MSDNFYRIKRPAVVNFSGGRSSGFMLYKILEAFEGSLPASILVLFCNTGKERNETLDFVHKCGLEWGIDIRWLEYRYFPERSGKRWDSQRTFIEVDYETASRDGKPFRDLIESRKILPSPIRRFCTRDMKVRLMEKFVKKSYGWRKYNRILGIRHDEKKRWGKILMTECDVKMPMVESGHTKEDVESFWKNNSFDLNIDSLFGNCDLCFMKNKGNLLNTIKLNPDSVDWWIEQENYVKNFRSHIKDDRIKRFRKEYSYEELSNLAKEEIKLEVKDVDEEMDCFCTD